MNIVETSMKKQPLIITVIFTALALGGLISFKMLNLIYCPSLNCLCLPYRPFIPSGSIRSGNFGN